MTASLFLSRDIHPSLATQDTQEAPFMSKHEREYMRTLLQEHCVADIEHWRQCYTSLPRGSGLGEQIVARLYTYQLLRRLIVGYLHGGLTAQECSVSISGSNRPTSDLDVSVMGPNVETFFWRLKDLLRDQSMSLAGFCKRFDVNFYAAPCVNLRGAKLAQSAYNDLLYLPVVFTNSPEVGQLTLMVSVDGFEGLPLPMTSKAIDVDWSLCLRQLLPYTPPTTSEEWELRLEQASLLHHHWDGIVNRQSAQTSMSPAPVDDTEHGFWDLLSQVMRMSPEAYYSCSATTLVLCILQNRAPRLVTLLQLSAETYAHVLFMAVVENAIMAKRHEHEARSYEKYHLRALTFARYFPGAGFLDDVSVAHLVSEVLFLLPTPRLGFFKPQVKDFVLPYLTEEIVDHEALTQYMQKKMSATTHYTRSQAFKHTRPSQQQDTTTAQAQSRDASDTSSSNAPVTSQQVPPEIRAPAKPSTPHPRRTRGILGATDPSADLPITYTRRILDPLPPSSSHNRFAPLPLQQRGNTTER